MRKEPVDLAESVRQMADLYQASMAERDHHVELDLQPVVTDADPALLNRVLVNLFDNEVAHLPVGCAIRIGLHAWGDMAELTLEDNGPGFPPALRDRLFERFVRGESSSGRGLGLAFVNAAIQAHGGHAQIGDRTGGGALIVVRLPMAEVLSGGVTKPAR